MLRLKSLTLQSWLLKLTGDKRVRSTQFKTKDSVDHAGLSRPSLLWRDLISLRKESFSSSLSNNLSTAPRLKETRVAMEVLKSGHSSMLRKLPWSSRKTTSTPQELEENARLPKLTKSLESRALSEFQRIVLLKSRQQLISSQPVFLLMLRA